MIQVNIREARAQLPRLAVRAQHGEESVISRKGKPIAKLVPFDRDRAPRPFGTMRSLITVADDFDAPLPGS